ncbi:MAG: RES family NAD+ phosphorylase [Verrucomicrobiota bacterium JB022]|nr:RES family NAD+ phosphorylase [Verrucomicrobiota bacterium JB022]
MRGFRLGTKPFASAVKDAFGGMGAFYAGGRWNPPGCRMVYLAEVLSLSALEVLVHLRQGKVSREFVFWEAKLPDNAVTAATNLPEDWATNLEATRAWGEAWAASKDAPAVLVPSVIVPTEQNMLVNPEHPDFDLKWVVRGPEPFNFDPRLVMP